MPSVILHKIGLQDYKKTWDYQEQLFDEVLLSKQSNTPDAPSHLIFCEHPHVYTLGRSGDEQNLLADFIQLQAKHAQFFRINRGGDITYHGPGQLVGYPIFSLTHFGIGVKEYIHRLEEAIISGIAEYGLKGERLEGSTGVWLDTQIPGKVRKICAIGVRTSHWVTMHGFALNINTDLSYFGYINPCGFKDKSVTSMEKELGHPLNFDEVSAKILDHLQDVFTFELLNTNEK
jgi:lipoyl(octanoyl) transferase